MIVPPVLYIECASGASGDMLAASLLALVADRSSESSGAIAVGDAFGRVVAPALRATGIDPTAVLVETVVRGGVRSAYFTVEERPGFASFAELIEAARRSALDDAVRDGVVAVAERMAAAERAVHGHDGEHLHELSSLDTAVDLIAVLALVGHLAPARIVASPPALGSGIIHTAHGDLPVPAPAVVELLRGLPTAGAGTATGPETGELTTPTGAALLAHLADEFGGLPPGRLAGLGVGAGRRELAGSPNVLRAMLIEPLDRSPVSEPGAGAWSQDKVELLETTIDDLSAELLSEAADRLFAAGALDVWFTPAVMKKSRPGTVLHALIPPGRREEVAATLFRETSTFGVRVVPVGRLLLDERVMAVEPAQLGSGEAGESGAGEPAGPIRVRLGYLHGQLVTVSPEYEDCRRAAARAGRPLKDVYDEARAAARRLAEE